MRAKTVGCVNIIFGGNLLFDFKKGQGRIITLEHTQPISLLSQTLLKFITRDSPITGGLFYLVNSILIKKLPASP